MKTTKKLKLDSKLVNVCKSKNSISYNLFNGNIEGNIIDSVIVAVEVTCVTQLDFSCADNSQYIPVI